MTPAARSQAAIEILDAVIEAARAAGAAADTLVQRYFATRRYAGSKDRRAVRDLVYAAIRACGEVPASGRAAMLALVASDPALADTFDGSTHGPAEIDLGEPVAPTGLALDWLIDLLTAAELDARERDALIARAPLDIRLNACRPPADPPGESIAGLPLGRRLPAGTNVEQLDD